MKEVPNPLFFSETNPTIIFQNIVSHKVKFEMETHSIKDQTELHNTPHSPLYTHKDNNFILNQINWLKNIDISTLQLMCGYALI